jgi:hypothetical protein
MKKTPVKKTTPATSKRFKLAHEFGIAGVLSNCSLTLRHTTKHTYVALVRYEGPDKANASGTVLKNGQTLVEIKDLPENTMDRAKVAAQ